jgi:hypothetical protein
MNDKPTIKVPASTNEVDEIKRGINSVLSNKRFKMTQEARFDLHVRLAMVEATRSLFEESEGASSGFNDEVFSNPLCGG